MSASAFHPISTALSLVSQSLSEVATAIPQGTSGAGSTADALVEKLDAWRGEFNRIAEHMQTQVAGPVETTAAADDELTRHPSPEQVTEAQDRAREARKRLMAKAISPGQYQAVSDEADALRREREEAVKQHAAEIKDMDKFEGVNHDKSGLSSNPYGSLSPGGGIGSLSGGGISGVAPASSIGTSTSGDPTAGVSRMGGVPQPPAMPPMQPAMAQPAAGGGGMPAGMGGMPMGSMPGANLPRDKRKKSNDDVAVGLSADNSGMGSSGAVAAVPVESRGDSVKGLNTKADISGMGRAVAAGGAAPGAGGAGGAGGARPMMGGPMGSGVGLGQQGKPKEKPLIYSSDKDLLGDSSVESAVQGGLIGRESAKSPSGSASK